MINQDLLISPDISMLDALAIMDKTMRKLLIICDGKKFLGVLSIGDIQRAILKKQDFSISVSKLKRKKVTYAKKGEDLQSIKKKMLEEKIECMPVVDENGLLTDIIEWNQLFTKSKEKSKVKYPVVIMAGGKGTRLLPLTNVIPKPLIPISDKTIIEKIMEGFRDAGSEKFYISVNYMTDVIKEFFTRNDQWDVEFLQEKKPLGTGGSLYLLKNRIHTAFFVTNCDTLIEIDLNDLMDYHRRNQNTVTIVTAVKSIHIPYGILETGLDGVVSAVREKPDYIYQVNSGFYVMEPDVFEYIRDEEFINVPDIIAEMIGDGRKVGAFPVSPKSWIDMGSWEEYLALVNKYRLEQ